MCSPSAIRPTTVIAMPSAKQQHREHARRGPGAERKSVHALQIARCPQGEQRDRDQRQAADKILRTANPFRHDDLTGTWLGVSLIDLSPLHRASRPFCSWMAADAGPAVLPSDFHQITPAKPKHPPASNIQSGLSRVAKASTAAAAVTRAAHPGPIRGQRQNQAAGAHQADRKRNQRRLNNGRPARMARSRQQAAHIIGKHGGRAAHRKVATSAPATPATE